MEGQRIGGNFQTTAVNSYTTREESSHSYFSCNTSSNDSQELQDLLLHPSVSLPFQYGAHKESNSNSLMAFQSSTEKVGRACASARNSKYVVFIVGPQKERMLGLKSQLSAKSLAFSEIIYSGTDIEHPEYSPASFGIFLKYIHSDSLCFAESHVCDLFRLAFVYDIPHIMNKCAEFAVATLSLENCLKYHLAAVLYDLIDLQALAFKFMVRQGPAFLHHPSFTELDVITLGSLIRRDDFVVPEVELFLFLLDWINAECQRLHYPPERKEFHRRVSGNLFQHVRFTMMSPKDFISLVVPTEILNAKDVEEILQRYSIPWQLWSTLPPVQYIERPRVVRQCINVPLYNQVHFNCKRLYCPNAKESLRFLASQDIYLTGIEFFGPLNSSMTSYKIKYQIENEFMGHNYHTSPVSIGVLAPQDFEIEFLHPMKISAQFPYKLAVWLEGQISQFSMYPVPQAVVMYNNSQIFIHIADNVKEAWGSNYHMKFNMDQGLESPGIIKSLLFQTVD